MRVAMVNAERARGGAARMAATLARAMHDEVEDIEVSLFHAADNEECEPFVGLRRRQSRPINALISRLLGSTAIVDFGVAAEIFERASSADILHIHNLHGYYLNYSNLLSKWKDRPLVWTWHDMWGATGRCAFASMCDRWKTGCLECGHLDYYPAAWIDRAKHEFEVKQRLYEGLPNLWIVTPSAWLREIAIERGFHADRVTVIANPVDLRVYRAIDKQVARKELKLEAEAYYIVFVAADCRDERKGFKDFNEVVEATGAYGLAVGKAAEGVGDQVTCVGAVSDPLRLSLYYSAADVLLLTSRSDNYPNTVIESQACGTPVFAYGVGGVPSQMPPGWNGVVRPNDLTNLCTKVREHMAQGGKGARDSEALRCYAADKWDPGKAATKYVEIYKAALESHRHKASRIIIDAV